MRDKKVSVTRQTCLLLLIVMMRAPRCAAAAPPDDSPSNRALSTLLAARPGSEADVQTAAAWKLVSQSTYGALPDLFAALDRASPLAANWISTALDQIVASQTADGKPVPLDVFEQTALDVSHSLLTRKTAIDLLERADAHRVEQLQSAFLEDPEAELRRPAIERAIDDAEKMTAEKIPADQRLVVWLRLLDVARDPDQVTTIAAELKSLGHEVDMAAHFGYLVDWQIIGPFDNTDGRGFDARYPPESLTLDNYASPDGPFSDKPLSGKSGHVSWKQVTAKPRNGDVDLNQEIEKLRDVCAYGLTVFDSDQPLEVDVRLRVQNSFKIWLNGQLLVTQPVGHTGNSFDQYTVRAALRKGKNIFLIKSCQVNSRGTTDFYDTWHFCVRVCDSTGGAILSTDRIETKKEAQS